MLSSVLVNKNISFKLYYNVKIIWGEICLYLRRFIGVSNHIRNLAVWNWICNLHSCSALHKQLMLRKLITQPWITSVLAAETIDIFLTKTLGTKRNYCYLKLYISFFICYRYFCEWSLFRYFICRRRKSFTTNGLILIYIFDKIVCWKLTFTYTRKAMTIQKKIDN